MKVCTCCGGNGPFGPNKKAKDGLKTQCRKCLADKQKAYAANNRHVWRNWAEANVGRLNARDKARYDADPEGVKARVRAWQLRNPEKFKANCDRGNLKKYGITPEQKETLFQKQQGKCLICDSALRTGRTGMQIDHDHNTGEVRGLLCHLCNILLGDFREEPIFLERAVGYLNKSVVMRPVRKRPLEATRTGTRVSNLWYGYRITPEALLECLAGQNGACGVCQDPLLATDVQVDHDHKLGRREIRGLLCRPCNLGLGHARESYLILQRAADYLRSKKAIR